MLALIAGSGRLPGAIVRHTDPVVFAYEGFKPDGVSVDHWFRIETLGTLFKTLSDTGVTQVCFAGGIKRPVVDPSAIDALTAPLVPEISTALGKGDDGALRQIAALFEVRGIAIVAAHQIAPDLLPESGVLTHRQPPESAKSDAKKAHDIIVALSHLDVGQSCVVAGGQMLTTEGQFGTQWMLEQLTERPDIGGGVLFKGPKEGQDSRFDWPVIGPETVDQVCNARLDGIVLQHGGVMILDQDEVFRRCNEAGIFLWVRSAEGDACCGSS